MSKVERLLKQYKAEHRASGSADAGTYLEQLTGLDRLELAIHIDRYLSQSVPGAFDAAAFERFRQSRETRVDALLADETLLDLTRASGLGRLELTRRLAAMLGVSGHETGVRGRLRDIENGDVPVAQVRPAVWTALAELVGESAERVRLAAERAAAGPARSASAAFLRATHEQRLRQPPEAGSPKAADPVDTAFFDDSIG
jgi:hypothetical protein